MSRETKLMVDQILHDLEHRPEDFDCTEHRLIDNKIRFSYWICNGIWFCAVDSPYSQSLGLIQGFRLLRGVRKWKAWSLLRAAQA